MEEKEIIGILLETNKRLTEHIVELSKEIAKIQEPAQVIPMQASRIALSTPETEEDANYALANNLIDQQEHKSILKELQFYTDEIIVPTA